MKKLFIFTLVGLAYVAVAAEQSLTDNTAVANGSGEEVVISNKEKLLRRTGGMIPNKKNAKGSIAVIDAQSVVDSDFVKTRVNRLENQLWFRFKYSQTANAVTMANLVEEAKAADGTLTVVLSDFGGSPAILHFPELRIVVVNIAALTKDSPDKRKLESRVAKQLSRATAFVLGLGYSAAPGGVLYPYRTCAELDDVLVDMLPSDLAISADYQAGVFGITRFTRSTYRKACEEGWAPDPKNEYQRAIWKEYHELPTEPIVIKSDKSK